MKDASRAPAMRVALFGSPAFALPTLEALAREHRLALVVAQPDKPAGRGMRTSSPPTVRRALQLGVPVDQPASLKRDAAFAERLRALDLDVAVTAAYGKILPSSLLEIPRHGFLNVHASLLPRYRGAAPVQWALIRGERETGVTIMQTEAGLDTGPIRLQRSLRIPEGTDAPELAERLAALGAQALLEALELLARGELACLPQDDDAATYAPMLAKEDGRIRWDDAAEAVVARHRGVAGWPGTTFRWKGSAVKALALRPASLPAAGGGGRARLPEGADALPGTVLAFDDGGMVVACREGAVVLQRVQPAGKRAMEARAWANGRGVEPGVRLG